MIVRKLARGGPRVGDDGSGTLPSQYYVSGPALTDANVLLAEDTVTGLTIPAYGDALGAGYPGFRVVSVEADWVGTLADGSQQYIVDVTSRVAQYEPGGEVTVLPRLRWRWGARLERVRTAVDCDGNVLVNAAGDPFAEGGEGIEVVKTLSVWQPVEAFSVTTQSNVLGMVNEESMLVDGYEIDKRQMLCLAYAPVEDQIEGLSERCTVEMQFEFRAGFWPFDHRAPNIGFNAWYDDDGTKKKGPLHNVNRADVAIDEPVFLSVTGRPINYGTYKISDNSTLHDGVDNPDIDDIRLLDTGDTVGWMKFKYATGVADPSSSTAAVGCVAHARRHKMFDFRGFLSLFTAVPP